MPDQQLPSGDPVSSAGAPQAGTDPTTTQTPPQAGEAKAPTTPSLTLEQALAEITNLRKENAGHRTKLNAFEAAQKKAEEAQMSELQKAQRDASEAQKARADLERTVQELRVSRALDTAAAKLGFADPDDARNIDWAALEFDDAGQPTNHETLLSKLLETKPHYKAAQAQQPPPRKPASAGASVNPPRSATNEPLTMELIGKMSPAEYEARYSEIARFYAQASRRQ